MRVRVLPITSAGGIYPGDIVVAFEVTSLPSSAYDRQCRARVQNPQGLIVWQQQTFVHDYSYVHVAYELSARSPSGIWRVLAWPVGTRERDPLTDPVGAPCTLPYAHE